ncbi:hypothetical protein [Streptomyces sp. NPDC088246]|uniref:hypothetical protein n=1 Tax=Streptomyces sp. NPDC088246 TaxID=3365842 RepID=UPI00380E8178
MLRPPGKPKDSAAAARRVAMPVLALMCALVPGGAIASLLVVDIVGAIAGNPVTWILVLNWFGMLASCVLALSLTRAIGKYAHSAIISFYGNDKNLRDREYVLYLRSFDIDKELFWSESAGLWASLSSLWKFVVGFLGNVNTEATNEERIFRKFLRFGRVIGVGRPGEEHPLPGVERFYLPLDDWKSDVSEGIKSARLVLMIAAVREKSFPEGTLWEFTETLRIVPPSQFLLLVCNDDGDYRRFKELASNFLTDRVAAGAGEHFFPIPLLPDLPVSIRSGRMQKKNPLRGVVRFNDDWVGEFAEFDPDLERGTRRARQRAMEVNQAEPLMELVERGLPGHAVPAPRESRWEVFAKRVPWIVLTGATFISVITRSERLVAAQKITYGALFLLAGVTVVINGFHIQDLIRRHGTKVSFTPRKDAP